MNHLQVPGRQDALRILDLGSGLGKMSESLFCESASKQQHEGQRLTISVVRYDALEAMLRGTSSAPIPKNRSERIVGVFEQLPFRNESYDAAMAGFAIRDAKDLPTALVELRASLKGQGVFLIVDLSKPNSRFKTKVIAFYWRIVAPLIATVASFKLGRKFGALYTTFLKLPNRSAFSELINRTGFEILSESYYMLGASAVILVKKIEAQPSKLEVEPS